MAPESDIGRSPQPRARHSNHAYPTSERRSTNLNAFFKSSAAEIGACSIRMPVDLEFYGIHVLYPLLHIRLPMFARLYYDLLGARTRLRCRLTTLFSPLPPSVCAI